MNNTMRYQIRTIDAIIYSDGGQADWIWNDSRVIMDGETTEENVMSTFEESIYRILDEKYIKENAHIYDDNSSVLELRCNKDDRPIVAMILEV